MSLAFIITILTGHWIGDYVLQTNVIAQEKATSIKWLLIHVLLYTLVIALCAFFIFPADKAIDFIAINSLLHFATDFVTSKLARKFHENQRVYFIIIGLDQMIHSMTLLSSAYLLS